MTRAGYPVRIRGVNYPSQAAAARALGVQQSAIYSAMERGTLENVGLGRNSHSKKPVSYDGTEYSSIAAMARSLGISDKVIRGRISWARKTRKVPALNGIEIILLNGE